MKFKDLIKLTQGKYLLLGNEAIARGALEGGLGYASAYPGTPSSDILESLIAVRDLVGIKASWAVNEKVAFESAYAAAISGVKSLVAMKHVGLNVAADPFMTSAYTGVEEGFVIVTADDPSMWSSQNEQDNRWYGVHAYMPVFEPSSPSEAKDITKYALEFSSRHKHPVILRTTTRISHTRGPVSLGPIPKPVTTGEFRKEAKYVHIPANARKNKKAMLERWRRISEEANTHPFNRVEGSGDVLIIASGIAYAYVKEAAEHLGLSGKVRIVKLGMTYPIPARIIKDEASKATRILVVEELDPVVEKEVKALLQDEGIRVKVHGKDFVGYEFELTLSRVINALAKFMGVETGGNVSEPVKSVQLPPRPPVLCPGCPYRPLFFEIRKILNQEKIPYIAAGDIGCYSLGFNPPYRLQDIIIEMGGSIGTGNGFGEVTNSLVIAIIGDSTFFHAGIPPLINAVWKKIPMIVIVLDNEITAMTGHQPSPATRRSMSYIPIENVVKGLGISFVKVIDPFSTKEVRNTFMEALKTVKGEGGPAVIIARRRCALEVTREIRRSGIEVPLYVVDEDKCIACRICYDWFACPAIFPLKDGKAVIDPELCVGCGACEQVCPVKAIRPAKPYDKEKIESFWR
ncbi:MAG: indolepyruvate ferredoxin oxidoreductase subunit alpha [Thermoprotei archaeon]|nr:MAG: indolepyruvate ferredoxin oxidoreductase subunit alpha [Thermoprotei archaeon]